MDTGRLTVWDTCLTDDEIRQIMDGVNPEMIQPHRIISFEDPVEYPVNFRAILR